MVSGFTRKRLNAKAQRHKGFANGFGRAKNAKAAKENNF
jgi:hypothetical protein